MPLRDHFHAPLTFDHSWSELHAGWPMVIVQQLYGILPKGYVAAPGVQISGGYELDISTYRTNGSTKPTASTHSGTSPWQLPAPTQVLDSDISETEEFEVRIYKAGGRRHLVAAIELVSPANKDRPDSRRNFVAKCAHLLRNNVCVSIVDLVTNHHFNLHAEVLDFVSPSATDLESPPPHIYVSTIRGMKHVPGRRPTLETWFYPLIVGNPLPSLPLWLDVDLGLAFDLETSYEQTCRTLHID